EGKRACECRHARAVPADDQEARRGRIRAPGDDAREVGANETLRAVGDARKRQRAARLEQVRRGPRHAYEFFPTRHAGQLLPWFWLKSRSLRNRAVSKVCGTAISPVTQPSSSRSGTSIRRSNSESSASLNAASALSAKRPMIRSISRIPRCQERNSSL